MSPKEDAIDILVVGSGLAGLTAAITARQAGAELVLIAESQDVVGGSTRLCDGMILGANTRLQRKHGIEDSAKNFFNEYMAWTQWELPGGLIKAFTEESGPAIDWLEEQGVEFHDLVIYGVSENIPRGVVAKEKGQGIVNVLAAKAKSLDIDIAIGQPVKSLIIRDGAVVGAIVGDDEVFARSVILASGGYGANPVKVAKWWPNATSAGDWLWYMGADGAQGDALDFAEQANARISGFDRGLRLPHPNFVNAQEPYIPGWQIMVNAQGTRFVDESSPYGAVDRAFSLNDNKGFIIFDDQALHVDPDNEMPAYKQVVPAFGKRRSASWNVPMMEEMIEKGAITQANSIAELAQKLGISPEQLEHTIAQYNAGAAEGIDAFGKEAKFLRPVVQAPFYGKEIRPATIAATGTGPMIDNKARVVDHNGDPIPGLFAAGERVQPQLCSGSVPITLLAIRSAYLASVTPSSPRKISSLC